MKNIKKILGGGQTVTNKIVYFSSVSPMEGGTNKLAGDLLE